MGRNYVVFRGGSEGVDPGIRWVVGVMGEVGRCCGASRVRGAGLGFGFVDGEDGCNCI